MTLLLILIFIFKFGFHTCFRESRYVGTNVIVNTCTGVGATDSFTVKSLFRCFEYCSSSPTCRRIMYCESSFQCSLYESGGQCFIIPTSSAVCSCYRKMFTCDNGDCVCPVGYYGDNCQNCIKDCREGKTIGIPAHLNRAFVQPIPSKESVETLCDYNAGSTMIACRRSHCLPVNFNRNYSEYATGFGNPETEFWMGLDYMAAITQLSPNCVPLFNLYFANDYIGAQSAQYHRKAAYYGVNIGDAVSGYALYLDGYNSPGSTTTQDALLGSINVNGSKFSTYDVDHTTNDCPAEFGGSGWFSHTNPQCTDATLFSPRGTSMSWSDNEGYNELVKWYLDIERP